MNGQNITCVSRDMHAVMHLESMTLLQHGGSTALCPLMHAPLCSYRLLIRYGMRGMDMQDIELLQT